MFRTEQNTVVAILADLRNILSRTPTCTKVETLTVSNAAAVKLNPPANCFLIKTVLKDSGGTGITYGAAKYSECSTSVASSTNGLNMNTNTLYEIKGANNINGFSVISLSGTSYDLDVEYFTY